MPWTLPARVHTRRSARILKLAPCFEPVRDRDDILIAARAFMLIPLPRPDDVFPPATATDRYSTNWRTDGGPLSRRSRAVSVW